VATTYASFFPDGTRELASLAPEETWWRWRGHDVHVARARRPDAAARVLVLHGAGGHAGAVWPYAALLAARGLDVAAVDLPLYGRTRAPDPRRTRYDDWVELVVALAEAEDDGRPLVLLGVSMGGMLAYEVGARSPHVAAVAATCLLDPRDLRTQAQMTRFGPLALVGGVLTPLVRGRVATTTIPIRRVADPARLSRDRRLCELSAQDPRGAGATVPLGFLASYLRYRHVAPEEVTTPLALVHPAEDAWTPPRLSLRVARRTAGPLRIVMLRGCGHLPIEQPGLDDLLTAVEALASEG